MENHFGSLHRGFLDFGLERSFRKQHGRYIKRSRTQGKGYFDLGMGSKQRKIVPT
jgi:hypothetical protein